MDDLFADALGVVTRIAKSVAVPIQLDRLAQMIAVSAPYATRDAGEEPLSFRDQVFRLQSSRG
jgi:hypothetical protein